MADKPIRIGGQYIFRYGHYGTPDLHPDHSAHRDQKVTVTMKLPHQWGNPPLDAFQIKADDGWIGNADESELETP